MLSINSQIIKFYDNVLSEMILDLFSPQSPKHPRDMSYSPHGSGAVAHYSNIIDGTQGDG